MNNTTNFYRVSITPTCERDLFALRYAFDGEMAHGEHQECTDDVLIASLLGWYLRGIEYQWFGFFKTVAQEFYYRVSRASGEQPPEEYMARRTVNRVTPSAPGHILTIDGIDNKTLGRIEARAHAVRRMLTKLDEIYRDRSGMNSFGRLDKKLAGYSDQAIMDLNIWFVLVGISSPAHEREEFPRWVKDEIQARGQARAEYETGTLVDDELVLEPRSRAASEIEVLPALSARERRAFMLKRRIHPGSQFWTDERIRSALGMGL